MIKYIQNNENGLVLHAAFTCKDSKLNEWEINFKGIDKTYIDNLLNIIKIWDNTPQNIYINDIFKGNIPEYFIKKIKDYNKNNSSNQIKNIEKTIN